MAHQCRYAGFETSIVFPGLYRVKQAFNEQDRSINKVAMGFQSHCSRRYRTRHLAVFLHAFAIYIYRQGDGTLSVRYQSIRYYPCLLDLDFFSLLFHCAQTRVKPTLAPPSEPFIANMLGSRPASCRPVSWQQNETRTSRISQ